MPKIRIDHVVSFSSEDNVHVANNILSSDPAKKWKCKQSGEISSTLVLQLEKAAVISGIDIGNENSAYIEVLVTRSGVSEDYKVLLVMSSFMSPLEARQNTNVNKVRMFSHSQLSEPEKDQKWDRIKIVCTQPFNRHVQYGLSFVTFYTPDKNTSTNSATSSSQGSSIGNFALRPDSPNNLPVGSLFYKRNNEQPKTPSAAVAIREAASAASTPVSKLKIKPSANTSLKKHDSDVYNLKERNRNDLLYKKEEEEPHTKIDNIIEKVKKTKAESSSKLQSSKREASNERSNNVKKRKTDVEVAQEIKAKEKRKKPFYELMQGVTIVISGIQNPTRANLRSMALSMGAKYKADWDRDCTHLICAFTNTPKFNQVKGKGKIVKSTWIEECHSQRKRLPWRRYCLDKNDTKKPESEDEIWEEVETSSNHVSPTQLNDDTDDEGFDDTELQERIKKIQTNDNKKVQIEAEPDCYSQLTDEETTQQNDFNDFPNHLTNIFDFKTFFIDKDLEKDVLQLLERYIIAYNGVVTECPSGDVDIYITSQMNVSKFRKFENQALLVRPDWIWHCHNSSRFVSTDDYEL